MTDPKCAAARAAAAGLRTEPGPRRDVPPRATVNAEWESGINHFVKRDDPRVRSGPIEVP